MWLQEWDVNGRESSLSSVNTMRLYQLITYHWSSWDWLNLKISKVKLLNKVCLLKIVTNNFFWLLYALLYATPPSLHSPLDAVSSTERETASHNVRQEYTDTVTLIHQDWGQAKSLNHSLRYEVLCSRVTPSKHVPFRTSSLPKSSQVVCESIRAEFMWKQSSRCWRNQLWVIWGFSHVLVNLRL